jgi:quercetin 2,3-dioxygenase
VTHSLGAGRGAWVQVARGSISVNGQELKAGDGAQIEKEPALTITGTAPEAELLLFDLA